MCLHPLSLTGNVGLPAMGAGAVTLPMQQQLNQGHAVTYQGKRYMVFLNNHATPSTRPWAFVFTMGNAYVGSMVHGSDQQPAAIVAAVVKGGHGVHTHTA